MKKIYKSGLIFVLITILIGFPPLLMVDNQKTEPNNPTTKFLLSSDNNNPIIWNVSWGGAESDVAEGVWSDGSFVYICGSSRSFGAENTDIILLKYDMDGNFIWNKTWQTEGYDLANDIWSDGINLYTCGEVEDNFEYQMLLIKWDMDGNQIWNRTWDGTSGTSSTYCKALWGYGSNIYTVGYNGSFNSEDMVIVKWDFNGNRLWENSWGTSESDFGIGVWTDDTAVYTTGYSEGLSNENSDMVLVKWDLTTGEFLDNNSWNYVGDVDEGCGIWGDNDYIYTCGYADTNPHELLTSEQYALVKWDKESTNLVWNFTYPQGNMERGKDLWGDEEYLYMIGTRSGKADLIKINKTSGELIWSAEWDAWEYGTNANYESSVWGTNGFLYTCGNAHKPLESAHNITLVKWDMLGKHPLADFTFNCSSLVEGNFVEFTYTGSEGDSPIYNWNFGDETPYSSDKNPIHLYSNPGTYSVSCNVTDIEGEKSSMTKTDIISVLVDEIPTADFTTNTTSIYAGEAFQFIYIGDLGNTPMEYEWDFGDNSVNSTDTNPIHTYYSVQNFTATLMVSDANGDVAISSVVITVNSLPEEPKILGYSTLLILCSGIIGILLIYQTITKRK